MKDNGDKPFYDPIEEIQKASQQKDMDDNGPQDLGEAVYDQQQDIMSQHKETLTAEESLDHFIQQAIDANKPLTFTTKDENGKDVTMTVVPASLSTDKENAFKDASTLANFFKNGAQVTKNKAVEMVKSAYEKYKKPIARAAVKGAKEAVKAPYTIGGKLAQHAEIGGR